MAELHFITRYIKGFLTLIKFVNGLTNPQANVWWVGLLIFLKKSVFRQACLSHCNLDFENRGTAMLSSVFLKHPSVGIGYIPLRIAKDLS